MKFSTRPSLVAALLAGSAVFANHAAAVAAELAFASPFSDRMVLQRDQVLRVWGTGKEGAKVAVAVDGKAIASATVEASGRWSAEIPALAAGGPHVVTVSSGGVEIKLSDVLVGDVWLCSGQSNMQWALRETNGGAEAAGEVAKLADIRLLLVPKSPAKTPVASFKAEWTVADAKSAAEFSAVAIHFARALREKSPALKGVPIGLVDCSFGGTRAEAWIPAETLAKGFNPEELGDSIFGIKPAEIYNGMLAPLVGGNFRGVLWYQGESNASAPVRYVDLLKLLISRWRADFRDPNLPFYLVQLPNFPDPWEGWAFTWVRDAQARVVAATPDTALAVTLDTPDGYDLHPRNKRFVGERLALLARAGTYGEKIVSSGPAFQEAVVAGAVVRVRFDLGGGVLAKGDGGGGEAKVGDRLTGFAVAGEDGVYHHATATVESTDTMVVGSKYVLAPKTVRYAWEASPKIGVFNTAGLPAAPFRTDNVAPASMAEVQRAPPVRRVLTKSYTAILEADGTLSSLQAAGQQMLSTDLAGGLILTSRWGPRKLFEVTEVGPQSVRFSDRVATVTYAFSPERIVVTIDNLSAEPAPARMHMSTLVERVGEFAPGGAAEFKRGSSLVSISGLDSVEKIFDLVYELKASVPPGQTRTIELKFSTKAP